MFVVSAVCNGEAGREVNHPVSWASLFSAAAGRLNRVNWLGGGRFCWTRAPVQRYLDLQEPNSGQTPKKCTALPSLLTKSIRPALQLFS